MKRDRRSKRARPYEGDVVEAFADKFGYRFADPALLLQALTHPSFAEEAPEPTGDNQRLEFLGDAVVGLVVARSLFESHPASTEGDLSKMRGRLVSASALAAVARDRELGDWLRLGRGEERTDGRLKTRLLADAVEALAGAIYLDGGFEAARAWVVALLGAGLDGTRPEGVRGDFKSELQERIQGEHKVRPEYQTVEVVGPGHEQTFVVAVSVTGAELGRGRGRSKKEAEQDAARAALRALTGAAPRTKETGPAAVFAARNSQDD